MGLLSKYKFTNKRHPLKAVMAVVLALTGIGGVAVAVYLSYLRGGQAELRYAWATIQAMLMGLVGLVLAIISRTEPDRYYLFPDLGIVLNLLLLLACGAIIALGLGWI